jgi:hypothetical protein
MDITPGISKLDFADKAIKRDFAPKPPPQAPGPPNANDAANAAQQLTDQMRARRGMLANIYAGAQPQQPQTGKTTLGT